VNERVGLRVGQGFDVHAFGGGDHVVLGGVHIQHLRGIKAHSDGDVMIHAIMDALLGAAALGDIGRHFPDTDPQFRNANSLGLLARAVGIVHEAGYLVDNVDAVVIAERPKLAPHVDRIRARLATTLGVDVGAVSLKGKTSEGMGEVGRGEAIVVHAVAMLRKG
jgi:2-C-methyl-D-erythritol 2,4-cyclodiphosphate synthase